MVIAICTYITPLCPFCINVGTIIHSHQHSDISTLILAKDTPPHLGNAHEQVLWNVELYKFPCIIITLHCDKDHRVKMSIQV